MELYKIGIELIDGSVRYIEIRAKSEEEALDIYRLVSTPEFLMSYGIVKEMKK